MKNQDLIFLILFINLAVLVFSVGVFIGTEDIPDNDYPGCNLCLSEPLINFMSIIILLIIFNLFFLGHLIFNEKEVENENI